MSPGHMLPGQISPLQLESVEDGPRTLPLKFGQNRVSIWLHLNPEGWWRVVPLLIWWLGIAKIQLPQPSLAGTWAELGNMASCILRGVVGGRLRSLRVGWELPHYSYLSPAKLGLGLSLAIIKISRIEQSRN